MNTITIHHTNNVRLDTLAPGELFNDTEGNTHMIVQPTFDIKVVEQNVLAVRLMDGQLRNFPGAHICSAVKHIELEVDA